MAGAPLMLTAVMIATATGGTVTAGEPGTPINGFSIDSRTLEAGDLFLAIVGERDGHEFVASALEKGAIGAVVSRTLREANGAPRSGPYSRQPVIIEVPDTTTALQDLGRWVRRQSGAEIVAITGSAGKTTTKETLAEFLSIRYRVIKNKGNFNNHLGLPLSLLDLRQGADVAVMELGMNHEGEIRLLVNIAEPEVRVWTNVGDAHLGHFESREAIADAKGEILENARAGDVLICNADDPFVMARVGAFTGPRLTFGLTDEADVRAEAIDDRGLDGTWLRVRVRDRTVDMHTPLLGRGNVSNLLAAIAVATHFDVDLNALANRAEQLRPAPHRGAVLRLPGGVTVVDDSYNSSPSALQRALEVIAREKRTGRKAAVLGEMLELGDHSLELHRTCGEVAASSGLSRLIVIGGEAAQALADAAVRAGMPPDAVTYTASTGAACDLITAWLRDGDLVLVKGSRGIRTDAVVDCITEAFS